MLPTPHPVPAIPDLTYVSIAPRQPHPPPPPLREPLPSPTSAIGQDIIEYIIQGEINDETDSADSVKNRLALAFTVSRRVSRLHAMVAAEKLKDGNLDLAVTQRLHATQASGAKARPAGLRPAGAGEGESYEAPLLGKSAASDGGYYSAASP